VSRDTYYRIRLVVDCERIFYSEETFSHDRATEIQDHIAGRVGPEVSIELIEQVHREYETGRRPILCQADDCREFAKRVFDDFCSEACRTRTNAARNK
jgi:hypothetical protein